MKDVALDCEVPDTGKRTRYKLKNHTDRDKWKASEFSHLDAMDKGNMF